MRYRELKEASEKAKLKSRMDFVMAKMKENPQLINDIFKIVKISGVPLQKGQQPEPAGDKINPYVYLDPQNTGKEKDHMAAKKQYLARLVDSLMKAQGDADDIENFLKVYGKVSFVDIKKLLRPGRQPVTNYIRGTKDVSDSFVLDLFKLMFIETAGSRGPGEVSLALLSPEITFPTGGGDLLIGNTAVEVKGEASKGGGRLKDKTTSFGTPSMIKMYPDPNIPEDLKLPSTTFTANKPGTRKAGGKSINIFDHAQKLEQIQKSLGDAFMREMIEATYQFVPKGQYNRLFKKVNQMDRNSTFDAIARMSFLNYKQELLAKVKKGGVGFNHIMFMTPQESLLFELDKMHHYVDEFAFKSIDFADKRNGPAVQTSLGI
jgi:hypothetical protein|tara:strand:+ start:364 stop:1491 length:1128 start_codon:yes stop_codon:yes gene_type:complete